MTTAGTAQTNLDRKRATTRDSKRSRRGYASGKDDYLTRLAKIEGQVRGLGKMIEDDRWCPDVVTQVSSVTRALQEVAVRLLNDHLHCCVVEAARRSPIDGQKALEEVASTVRQVMSL
jgi:DNA-binding FrmR family transcriptional regulator